MANSVERQRYCDICGTWRTVTTSRGKKQAGEFRRCRKHGKRPNIGARYTHPTLGYVLVITEAGQKYEHRVIWEQHYGPIPEGYHVHHRNHVKDDNRIENLELVEGRRHNRDHTRERHKNGDFVLRASSNKNWIADLDNDEIVRRKDAGESFRSIARCMGSNHTTVSLHYRRAKAGEI